MLPRRVVHPPRVLPGRPQVLVVEDGDDAAVLAECAEDLAQESAPGVEVLAERVPRVLAVLGDADDAIDGDRVRAGGQGLLDGVEDRNPMLSCEWEAELR